MSKNRDTAVVTVGFGQGSKVDSVPMGSRMTHIPEALTGQRGPGKPQSSGPRHGRLMHQSTLSLGDPQGSGTSYTTTHTQSYCGREADGQPLVFFPQDPAYPSQHTSQLNLSHTSTSQSQTHSRDIHNPKDIIPFNVLHRLGQSNWSRNREGVAMREVTNPKEPTPYWTTYRSEHRSPSPFPSPHDPTGRPTLWHQHDILTGNTHFVFFLTCSHVNPQYPVRTTAVCVHAFCVCALCVCVFQVRPGLQQVQVTLGDSLERESCGQHDAGRRTAVPSDSTKHTIQLLLSS
ncbi:uncharacterized protein LOC109883947 isoform X2 [Oncorhynchus kisutch]|uniref:uncharacterized protein LOC109883947 isoform X2 n=1 Tax=Oncorhynchus kisutch TaxID=8019 RepID=UPI0012DCA3DD|nr:uncharacterized protein LOC109883947 isoform X2 [Oncorhynchus kisutch]